MESGLEIFIRHRGDHKRNPNQGGPVSEEPITGGGGGGNTIPRGTVTNANGSSDCSSVRPEALAPSRPRHVMSVFGRTLPSREIIPSFPLEGIESTALRGEGRRGKRNDK